MNKHIKSKLIVFNQIISFFIFFNFTINNLESQTIYTEAFSSVTPPNLPGGWTRSTNETLIRSYGSDTPSSGYTGASGGNHLFVPNCQPVGEFRWFMVEGISTSGATGLTVSFGQRWTGAFDVPILFEWSADGINWNTISASLTTESSMGWHLTSFPLPSGAENQTNLRFMWSYTTDQTNNCITATPNYRIDDFVLSATVLPVELINFIAVEKNNSVHLSWTTASENNSDIFEIERSTDGVNFNKIGATNAAGFSNKYIEYHFRDNTPYLGKNYYRLKQYDLDGAYQFSEIKNVTITNTLSNELKIHTNSNQLFIQNIPLDNSEYAVIIFDYMGREKLVKLIPTINGEAELNINHLNPGMYILTINNNGRILNKRFFKN